MATWEVANRCPECNQPGKVASEQSLGRDGKIVTLFCEGNFCKLANSDVSVIWLVQVRADGTIPDPQNHMSSPKEYKGFDEHMQQANAYAEMILRESLRNNGP